MKVQMILYFSLCSTCIGYGMQPLVDALENIDDEQSISESRVFFNLLANLPAMVPADTTENAFNTNEFETFLYTMKQNIQHHINNGTDINRLVNGKTICDKLNFVIEGEGRDIPEWVLRPTLHQGEHGYNFYRACTVFLDEVKKAGGKTAYELWHPQSCATTSEITKIIIYDDF